MDQSSAPKLRFSLFLYLAVALTAFFPCLFLGKAYFANDLLNQYSHFRAMLRTQLSHGHFPLWNPYFFGGQPFFADPNVMMTYPLNYLTLLFPIPLGLGVFFFLHMFLAALGMHLWLKALRLSETACRVGALTFALSGFFWWELIHPPILAALALFPWLMACLEKLQKELSPRWAFLSGLAFALLFCCGNFQSTSCALYTALVYFFFRVLFREETSGAAPAPIPWKKLIVVLLFSLWGGLPLAAHLIPADEFSKYSNRRSADQTYDQFNGLFSMHPASTYEFLFPGLGLAPGDTLENAIQQVTDQKNMDNLFLGAFGYIGVWAPLLIAAAFRRKDKKFQIFLLAVGILAILTAWGRYFPLHQFLCSILPTIDLSRAPFRFVQTYVLFGSVLAAFGYQSLERQFQERGRSSSWLPYAGVYVLFLGIAGAFHFEAAWREMLALGLGAFGLGLWGLTDSWQKIGRWSFQAALLFPLLLSGWNSFSLGPQSNYDLAGNFPALATLQEKAQAGRFYFDPAALEEIDGVEKVLDRSEQAAYEIDHPSSGDFVVIAEADAWFTYYWWLDDALAPPYARQIDIHRKPAYDPVELFFDPATKSIPLRPELVRGSHGRPADMESARPALIVAQPGAARPASDEIDMREVPGILLGLLGDA